MYIEEVKQSHISQSVGRRRYLFTQFRIYHLPSLFRYSPRFEHTAMLLKRVGIPYI